MLLCILPLMQNASPPAVAAVATQEQTTAPTTDQQPVEVPSMRTADSRTFRNPNGTFTAEVHPTPIFFKDGSGQYQSIDDSLVPSLAPGYAYENHANSYAARFPSSLGSVPIHVQLGS